MATKHINTEEKKKSKTLIHTNYMVRWQNTEIYQKWQNWVKYRIINYWPLGSSQNKQDLILTFKQKVIKVTKIIINGKIAVFEA